MTTPTFGGVGGKLVPDPPQIPPTPRHRRLLVSGLVVLLVLAAGGYGVHVLVERHQQRVATQALLCPGLTGTGGPGFGLSMVHGECIGWTSEQDYAFSPQIRDVTSKIIQQNRMVAQRGTRYARVAVLMPMTGDDTTVMTGPSILNGLLGVYAAQARANDPDVHTLGSGSLAFQVVLANEGRSADQWPRVIDQLAPMTGGEHPLVAVTGLGSSVPSTKAAAEALSERGIPAVGAVLTATDMTARALFNVSPSNVQYMAALRAYVDEHPELVSGFLLRDSKDDNYLNTLYDATMNEFGSRFQLASKHLAFTGSRDAGGAVPDLFTRAADEILCTDRTDILFFSGRSRDLAGLIKVLAANTGCVRDKPLVIATGSTGLGSLDTDADLVQQMRRARISVVDASSTDYRAWAAGTNAPAGYREFHDYYGRVLHLPEAALADGYVIMHHDALLTAVWTARRLYEENNGDLRTLAPQNFRDRISGLHGTSAVPAASGQLSFDDLPQSQGRPHGKPVPLIEIPAPATPTSLPLYTTP